ncbi:uncharacterized protein LOC122550348 [Chiloscyllium plagiosum]|uniref:uncharacterized protein LOC122550348 n=1 Tax=Chiloscyllium plagiosum TaxID=36176 RepID=UPI001CB8084C|nr:uncharacterized protein LOC122550348 [Chiloscyllium plagiosum]
MPPHRTNSDGLPQYHLRRIGRRASLPDIANLIDFRKRVTLIGRNGDVVDYVLSAAKESRRRTISKTHARIIRSLQNNQHRLVDSSFSGVYINDCRIDSDVILKEGDTVTFGHPQGSQVDRGERVRQPNSEFYFMFELCDCEQEGSNGLRQDPGASSHLQSSMFVPASCQRLPMPQCFLGMFPGFLQGVRWPVDVADAGVRHAMALHDSGGCPLVSGAPHPTYPRPELAPPRMMCFPDRQLAPEISGSTSLLTGVSHGLVVPLVPPGSTSQYSASAVAEGSQSGWLTNSQITHCGSYLQPVDSGKFDHPTCPGPGEHSNRPLPESRTQTTPPPGEAPPPLEERPGSKVHPSTFQGNKLALVSLGQMGWRSEDATVATTAQALTPMPCFHQDSAKRGSWSESVRGYRTSTHTHLTMDQTTSVKGDSTGLTAAGSVTLAGSTNQPSQRDVQEGSPSMGEHGTEAAVGMEWAPSMLDATAAVSMEPQLDSDTVVENIDNERTETELRMQDGALTEEVQEALDVVRGGVTPTDTMPTLSNSCWDSVESQCHLLSDDSCLRQSELTESMEESETLHSCAAKQPDHTSKWNVENEEIQSVPNEIGSAERPVQTVIPHSVTADGSFIDFKPVESNSVSGGGLTCGHTGRILHKPIDDPRNDNLDKNIPASDLLCQDRDGNTMTACVGDENMGSPGEHGGSGLPQSVNGAGPLSVTGKSRGSEEPAMAGESPVARQWVDDDLRKDVNCDRSETVGAEGESASDPGVQPVECELAARVSNVQIPSCSGMESDLSSNGQSQDVSSRCPPVSKATLDADSTTEHLSSSDNTFVFDKPHLLGTLGLRLEASDASPGETTGQMGKGGRLVDPELSDTDSKSAVTGKVEVPDVDGLSVASKAAEDSTIQTEGWSAKVCNPALADCPPSPISLSNDDGSAYSAGIEPEALLFIKAARSVCSIPVSSCSPTDHSASELANSVNLPSLDPGKGSCCSIVELGHSNQAGPQGGVSAAGQLCEGEWPSTEHGETTGDIRGCVIQGNTPEISKPEGVVTFMESVEMQCERDSIDQSELDATDQTCESHDGRLNLLECKEFPSIPIGSVDVNVETVGGHTLNTGMVKEGYLHGNSSGVVETSETLVSTLEDNSMEIGDTVGSDEDMDVDSVSRSVARDEIVESDLSNTCPAPSELQLTSARVIVTEAGNCGAEGEVDESPLSERSPVAPPLGDVEREEELEGSEPLMPVREPANQFGLEAAETLVARQLGIGVAHVPSCTVTPANYDTLCPLMQSETLNSTAEKETINQSHCKHSAMNVPSSDNRVLSSLEFQAEAASSENLLEAAMVTPDRDNLDPSQDESHPEPGVTDEPLALSETGQDQPRLDHVEGEGHLTSGFLTTDVQSELLSESCNHFTNTVTTKIVRHFPGEERVNLSPVMDSEIDRPGPHLPVGNGKFETTKSPIQYCPPVRPMALTSCPVAEAGESPESPARTVPLSPSTMGATWHGGRDSPVTHGCQEGAPMSENAAEIRDEFRDSGETADAPSADSTEEPSIKKVRACTGSTRDCESSVCNPSLLGEASATAAAAHFGVTTLTELSVTTNNSVLLSESVSVQRSDLTSSVPDAWPVTQEAYPTVDTACGSESELSGGNDQAAGWHDEPLCLGAADTDQFEQAMPHAHDEVPEVGLSGTEGTERTQFLLVHGGKAEAVDGVEGELVQPSFSDSQRIELEDPVEEQSEDENIAEELMLRPATPENRELQSHSPLVKELNLTGRELPMSLGLCRGAEEEESTVTGVLGDDANCCSMEETQLTGREGAEGEEDEICSDEHAVQPELTPGRAQVSVCQEEGLVWITAAPRIQPQLFTAAVPPRPGGRETGGVGQKQLKAGEQPTPASSEKDVLLEETSGEMARSRVSEEPAGLLELCVGVCRAREQAGSPTASPSPDTRQQCVQYDLEMDSSKRENPKAGRETGLLDKVSGEGSIPVSQFPETLDSYGLEGEEESSEQSASGHVTPCEPMERNDLSEQTASEEEEASYPEQLTCTQLPGTLSDSALATVENAEELNIIMGKANLNVSPPSPDCTDVGEVNLSLPTSIRNKGDPVQTSRTVTPCTCVSEDERISEDICRPTGFSEESMVFGEEGAEDLELDDEQLERKHHSHLPPGHREQQFIFSKEAEDQSAGEGMPRRGVAQIVQGTLGELGLCTQRETVPQTLSILQNGVVPTHSDCATNVSECKDSRARSQQGAEVQKPSDGILKKCCPKNRGVEQETETVALGERGQFQQEENVAQPSLLSEEHGAVLPQTLDRIPFGETPIQSPVSPNPEAESVHIEWQDMGRDGMGKCQVIVGSTDLAETGAADISRTDGVVKVSSTIVSSDPKYLNLQPSESQLKREDITSKSLNSQMNLNSRPSKRPCEGEEALGSKSTASSPSKRVCLPQQAGTEGLASAEGQNVTLLSLSAEQRQHQAWYIGRLVQQFVTEYRASQECRVTGEVRAVSKQDEVRRIVREFFKTQVAKSEEPIVDLPQQSVEMGDSDQCHRSENSEPRQEPRETSDDKSPCLMGSSSDCGPGTNGSGSSTSTEPLPLLSRPSSELVNWHVGARGDSESSLEEAGKLARKTGTVQETAQGDTFHVMSPGPSNCVPGDTDPMQEVTVAEGAHPSLSLTEESGTNVEAFDASRVSWSSLAHRSPNADSHEGLENGGLGAWESQATPAGSDGTAITASNKMGSSLLEILRTATGSLSCAVLECDGEAETDSGSAALADGSADQGVADVTGGCCSHSSSTDKSPPPSPALSTSPEANSPGQPGEMRCLSLAEPSSPGDSSNCSQDVIESCNPMESPPSSHNNPGYSYNVRERRVNVDGVESDPPPHPPPLRISEVWSIQSCSSGEGHFPALDPAPSHFTELLPNTKGGCTWKPEHECPTGLSGPPEGEASSAAKVSGLGSDMLSSNGQQGEAEAFCLGFTSDRSPRLETEPSKRVVAQNIDMRDADHSSSSLVWRGDLHREGDIIIPTSIQEAGSELGTKPYLELLEDPVTSQNDIGIRRLRADFLGSSKEETGTDRKRTSLATNQISSVGCVEGRTEEGGSALCMDHDAKPVLGLLPAPTERAVSPQHDAADERESQEFGEETSVRGCSVVSKRLREVSPPQGVPLVNRLSLRAKKRIRTSSDGANDTADPSLSRSPPRPGLSWTPSPPRPGLSRSPSPSRPGLSQSPSRPGLSQSPSRPGLSQSPSRPGLSQSPSRPGLSQSPRPASPSHPPGPASPSHPLGPASPSHPLGPASPSLPVPMMREL